MKPNLWRAVLEAQSLEYVCIHNGADFVPCITLKVSQKTWTVLSSQEFYMYLWRWFFSKSFWAWTNLYLFIVLFCTICIRYIKLRGVTLRLTFFSVCWCGSVHWPQASKPKSRHFDSQSGHMPGLQARSPVGGAWETTAHWCFSPVFLSLPSPL